MACVQSKIMFWAKGTNKYGNRYLVVDKNQSDGTGEVLVPCQTCIGCRADQARDWGIRCHHEAQTVNQSCFLTLTFENEPEYCDLRELQLFNKRLRKKGYIYKYFACGESGDKSGRWHYHQLVFGHDFLGGAQPLSGDSYYNKTIQELWNHGIVHLSPADPARCMYAAGYTAKKLNPKIGRPLPLSCSSSRPPIGHNWVMKNHENMNRLGHCVVGGKEVPIPKAYYARYAHLLPDAIKKRDAYIQEHKDNIFTVDHEKAREINAYAKYTKNGRTA